MGETLFNYTMNNYFNLKMHNSFDCDLFHLTSRPHLLLYICKLNKNYYSKPSILYDYQDSLRSRKRNAVPCGGRINHRPRRIIPKRLQWIGNDVVFMCVKINVVHIR